MSNFWQRCAPLMGLQYVRRWALVQMDRDQTVGDHCYRVWVMARDLYKVIDPTGHNSDNYSYVQLWALIHDADEYWTSDFPGHVKKSMNDISPGIVDKYVATKFAKVMPEYLEVERGCKNSIIAVVVKICDLVESYIYLQQHATRLKQKEIVGRYIMDRLNDVIIDAKKMYPTYEWQRFGVWIGEVLAMDEHEDFRLVATSTPAAP